MCPSMSRSFARVSGGALIIQPCYIKPARIRRRRNRRRASECFSKDPSLGFLSRKNFVHVAEYSRRGGKEARKYRKREGSREGLSSS